MNEKINQFLDFLSDYLSQRKGLLPIISILLIIINGVLQFTSLSGWIINSNLLLHIGIILAIIGFMLAWAL